MYKNVPKHVAIIMDGNGRWALQKGLLRVDGHIAGVDTVKVIVQACLEKQIEVLSLFAFSCENWLRPAHEIEFIMQLFVSALEREIQTLHDNGVHIRFSGDRTILSAELCAHMDKAEKHTVKNKKLLLNVCLNYSGRWDITQAAKVLSQKVVSGDLKIEDINEEIFAKELNTSGITEPDLLIRTSGEQRLSNFFLWQAAYTELYFAKVMWPDFTKDEFEKALKSFNVRERRYGKISQQLCGKKDV